MLPLVGTCARSASRCGGRGGRSHNLAIAFKEQFRADYGSQMPDFVETSHKEALDGATSPLVYLHPLSR